MRKTLIRSGVLPALATLLVALDSPEPVIRGAAATAMPDTSYKPSTCMIENTAFQAGEEMVYKVYYNWNFVWMPAGEATFRVTEEGGNYHLSVTGATYKSYEWFYRVFDKYDTYVDKETLLPQVSVRDVQEGKYRLYDRITFDQRRNVARSLRGKSRETAEVTEYPIENCMHDILSIIYYSRNIDFNRLSPGSDIPIKVFVDKKIWNMRVRYLGKDDKKKIRHQGHYKTIMFSPEVAKGFYFKDKDQMRVWVSDDKNRIPLMIESPISVGSVKAILQSYKGLRHPFDAEVKEVEQSPKPELRGGMDDSD